MTIDDPLKGPEKPGNEAPDGTPGAVDDICPACGGSGKKDGEDGPNCLGTGLVQAELSGG